MQAQADISGAPVNRPKCVETTAMGAAYLAGLASGYWENKEEVLANWASDRIFTPQIPGRSAWRRSVGGTSCPLRVRLGKR